MLNRKGIVQDTERGNEIPKGIDRTRAKPLKTYLIRP